MEDEEGTAAVELNRKSWRGPVLEKGGSEGNVGFGGGFE